MPKKSSTQDGMHPYMRDNFWGTPETREALNKIENDDIKLLIRDGKKVYIK